VSWRSRPDIRIEQTRPGEMRQIALNDGTRIELSGGSRLRYDRHDTRTATLEQGQALFSGRERNATGPATSATAAATPPISHQRPQPALSFAPALRPP
jgi:ferric-dicitrate binding protein FerR (iron transport regulator)